ncbi:sulfite exporter TauE/SafE family protein [Candidatus Kuenenbacteria bacterium]|nr:sulfite exporter TauE/SafE family protein [Candidatus Kuenenbacteria bacterium]
MTLELIAIFIITVLVRIVTVMVGGGGLILIPMLIFFGFPPSVAIATNRIGGQADSIALFQLHKAKQAHWKLGLSFLIPSVIGVILGTLVVIKIDQDFFEKLIAIVMLVSLPIIFWRKEIGLKEKTINMTTARWLIGGLMALVASFLGGLFSMTGMWFNFVYLFLGLTFIESSATRKIHNTITGLLSSVILVFAGLVNWPVAVVMFVASAIGSIIGTHFGLKAGNIWIRRLFILVVLISALKIILF